MPWRLLVRLPVDRGQVCEARVPFTALGLGEGARTSRIILIVQEKKDTEVQRREGICPRSPNKWVTELRLESKFPGSWTRSRDSLFLTHRSLAAASLLSLSHHMVSDPGRSDLRYILVRYHLAATRVHPASARPYLASRMSLLMFRSPPPHSCPTTFYSQLSNERDPVPPSAQNSPWLPLHSY